MLNTRMQSNIRLARTRLAKLMLGRRTSASEGQDRERRMQKGRVDNDTVHVHPSPTPNVATTLQPSNDEVEVLQQELEAANSRIASQTQALQIVRRLVSRQNERHRKDLRAIRETLSARDASLAEDRRWLSFGMQRLSSSISGIHKEAYMEARTEMQNASLLTSESLRMRNDALRIELAESKKHNFALEEQVANLRNQLNIAHDFLQRVRNQQEEEERARRQAREQVRRRLRNV